MFDSLGLILILVTAECIPLGAAVSNTVIDKTDACGTKLWTDIHLQLSRALNLLDSGNPTEAFISTNHTLLNGIIADPRVGFQCAIGSGSIAAFLARYYEVNGDNLRSLRLRQTSSLFTSAYLQTHGENSFHASGWFITWQDSVQAVIHGMTWFVSRDRFRNIPMRQRLKESISSRMDKKLDIGIVTVCDYDAHVTPLSRLSRYSKQHYATRHGYTLHFYDKSPKYVDYFTENGDMDPRRPAAWSKLDALLEVLSDQYTQHDWIMWMDCDSFFMDYSVKLESVIEYATKGSDNVLTFRRELSDAIEQLRRWTPSDPANLHDAEGQFGELARSLIERDKTSFTVDFIASEDGLMLNTGVFLLRRRVSIYYLIWRVRQQLFKRSALTFHPWWEQTAMLFILMIPYIGDKSEWMTVSANNGFPSFAYMFSQKQLNGYPPLIAGMLKTHAQFEEDDFIISFSGCKTYTSQSVCNDLMTNHFLASEIGSLYRSEILKSVTPN